MWLREQGHVFDWGTLKWCQTYTNPPNGCYDAENISLDEFGHVDGLGHHVNKDDGSDYLDAVVQTYSRTKPNTGWNVHAFGRVRHGHPPAPVRHGEHEREVLDLPGSRDGPDPHGVADGHRHRRVDDSHRDAQGRRTTTPISSSGATRSRVGR